MRTKGTKYEIIEQLPPDAMPVAMYARKNKISSPAYVHVKYDRFKFGYKNSSGKIKHGEPTSYEIRCFQGINYVIPV